MRKKIERKISSKQLYNLNTPSFLRPVSCFLEIHASLDTAENLTNLLKELQSDVLKFRHLPKIYKVKGMSGINHQPEATIIVANFD